MKVFLSWSGNRSKAVALALKELLPSVLQPITCWMSDANMAKGKPWFDQLRSTLDDIVFGVFCVTPENESAIWLQWEAGFLSSKTTIGDRRVAPIAIGMSKGSLSGPLSIYQATDAAHDDLLRLIKEINLALPEDRRVPENTLERTYGFIWPELEKQINAALALPVSAPATPKPSEGEQLTEIMALLRDNQREAAETKEIVRRLEFQSGPSWLGGSDPTNIAAALTAYGIRAPAVTGPTPHHSMFQKPFQSLLDNPAAGAGTVFKPSSSPKTSGPTGPTGPSPITK